MFLIYIFTLVTFISLIPIANVLSANCDTQTLYSIEAVVAQNCITIGNLILNDTLYTNTEGLQQVTLINNLIITNNKFLINITLNSLDPRLDRFSQYAITISNNPNLNCITMSRYSESNLNAFPNGNIIITYNEKLESVSFPSAIWATPQFEHNPSLTNIFFPLLTSSKLKINNNLALDSLIFPSLIILNYFSEINFNPLLSTIFAPQLISFASQLISNPSIVTLEFAKVIYITISAHIYNNSQLQTLNFPLLSKFHGRIEANPLLTNVSIPKLTQFEGQIINNPLITTLIFPFVTQLSGSSQITNNRLLTRIDFPLLISVIMATPVLGGTNTIQLAQINNNSISSLNFPLLTSVLPPLEINNNAQLISLSFGSLNTIDQLQISNNINLKSLRMPLLVSATDIDISANPQLFDMHSPSLRTVTTLNLESLAIKSINSITGLITSATSIRLFNLSYLENLNGLTVSSASLILSDLPLITSLRGLALDIVPQGHQLVINNNKALTSLDGLQRLIRIPGVLEIQNNDNLKDYSALNNVLFLASPVILDQCCPSFDFMHASSLFQQETTFKCRICTTFNITKPSAGPVTGGTSILIYVNSTVPSPTLYFKFNSAAVLCAYQPMHIAYSCTTPSSTKSGPVSIYVSFDDRKSFNATSATFTYQEWQYITGNNQLQFSTYTAESSIQATTITNVDPLPGLPVNQIQYANILSNYIIICGASIVMLLLLMLLVSRFFCANWCKNVLCRVLSRMDYIRLNEADPNQHKEDGNIVVRRTSILGGIICVCAYIMALAVVIAYIAQTFIDPDTVTTALSPSNSRTVRSSAFTATIELLQYNGACDCANTAPELMPTISGFIPAGNFTCTAKPNPVGNSNCVFEWQCNNCRQNGLSSQIELSTADSNVFMQGMKWSFTVVSYLNTTLRSHGSVNAAIGSVFKGNTQKTQVPLSITPASFQQHGGPVLYGYSIDAGTVLPGSQQSPSTLAADSGLTVQLNTQPNIVWIDVIIAARFTNLSILAQMSAILAAVLASASKVLVICNFIRKRFTTTTKTKEILQDNPAVTKYNSTTFDNNEIELSSQV